MVVRASVLLINRYNIDLIGKTDGRLLQFIEFDLIYFGIVNFVSFFF